MLRGTQCISPGQKHERAVPPGFPPGQGTFLLQLLWFAIPGMWIWHLGLPKPLLGDPKDLCKSLTVIQLPFSTQSQAQYPAYQLGQPYLQTYTYDLLVVVYLLILLIDEMQVFCSAPLIQTHTELWLGRKPSFFSHVGAQLAFFPPCVIFPLLKGTQGSVITFARQHARYVALSSETFNKCF